ncbi:hypothetical protein T439DRAFT_325839 [Meredithblackwellia eburnea MCA 4105]
MEKAVDQAVTATEKKVEKTITEVEKGEIDTINTPARYLAFGARLRPIVQPFTRYLAYSSDVGESFRPVVNPKVVTAAYGVSWAYVIGDVGYEGYKARLRALERCPDAQGSVVGLTMAKRAIFQGVGSMLLPALTIHSIVKYSARAIASSGIKNPRIKAWGPTALGLGFVPALPFIFDEPVEHVVDLGFDKLSESLYSDKPNVRSALAGDHAAAAKEHEV